MFNAFSTILNSVIPAMDGRDPVPWRAKSLDSGLRRNDEQKFYLEPPPRFTAAAAFIRRDVLHAASAQLGMFGARADIITVMPAAHALRCVRHARRDVHVRALQFGQHGT